MPFPRKITPQQTTVLLLLAFTGALIAFLIPAVRYFRTLTGAMAVSNASDLITQTVSNIVENEMRLLGPDGGKFVSFEKDGDGQISAIVTDTSRVNILAVLIGFHHRLVPAVECSHTQFDLRKIERQDQMIFRSLNKIADTDGIVAFSGAVL